MKRYSAFHPYGLFSRELGLPRSFGAEDATAASLYCGMKPVGLWDSDRMSLLPSGGIFNLEFSPEGNILVAACEKKSLQVFDPLTHKRVHSLNGAHSDCVNCVRFLDSKVFATCSDDTTIALWDIRNFKKKIATMHGHSNWVKNIEFSAKDKLLVSCGLDGSIFTWDISSYTDCSLVFRRVFHATDLMRCRLSPDAQQMIMCTTGGLIIIVHNLDLNKLSDDFKGFKPNLYRLMQRSKQYMPVTAFYNHLFDKRRTRNRVEFISDFPQQNDAEVICSLQIHPQGWTVLSRNISHSDRSEWTCVHDIQSDLPTDKSTTDASFDPSSLVRCCRSTIRYIRNPVRMVPSVGPISVPQATDRSERPERNSDVSPRTTRSDVTVRQVAGPSRDETNDPDNAADVSSRTRSQVRLRAEMVRETDEGRSPGGLPGIHIQNDVWVASLTIRQSRILQAMASRGQVGRTFNMQHITGINTGIPFTTHFTRAERARIIRNTRQEPAPSLLTVAGTDSLSRYDFLNIESEEEDDYAASKRYYVKHNKKRMLYYVEEPNEGRGFIKELCYSADGRVICSPFGKGMRLLAHNEKCMDLSRCVDESKPRKPKSLIEVGRSTGHKDLVVSARFSPRHQLLVTGCLAGQVIWYQPYSGESIM